MQLALTLETTQELDHLSPEVENVNAQVRVTVHDKDYGGGLDHLYIGVILMDASAGGAFQSRPFSFKKSQTLRRIDGTKITYTNLATFDIRPSYEEVRSMSPIEFRRRLSEELVSSLQILRDNQKKFSTLDVELLCQDLRKALDCGPGTAVN